MSWGNYSQGQGGYNDQQGQDAWGRTYQSGEPSGYVTNDPYATPSYNQQGASYSQPYGPPGMVVYAYSPANPPRPSVGPGQALKLFFKNYAVFHGRASRSEYWWMYLWAAVFYAALIIPIVLAVAADPSAPDMPPLVIGVLLLGVIMGLGVTLPTISLQVRRLHDAGFSGFFAILAFVPYLNSVTSFVPFVLSFFRSTPSGIKYDNPNGTQPAVN